MQTALVIGSGVIGLSVAYELARAGLRVRVLDQSALAREASWAGAGMLPPGAKQFGNDAEPLQDLETRLRTASARIWPQWAHDLQSFTGIEPGYRQCGALEVQSELHHADLDREMLRLQREGIEFDRLSGDALRSRFPRLNSARLEALWIPGYAQVRNPRLLKSLMAACLRLGVELSPGHPANSPFVRDGRLDAVSTPNDQLRADHYILATGSWTAHWLRQLGVQLPVSPVRGQIVLLEQWPAPIDCIVQSGLRYIVPRADGKILIGSTEEHVGFEKRNTAMGVQGLLEFGSELIPGLQQATHVQSWAGLRPYLPGGLPWIGRVPHIQNLVIAAGHFRSGLQLSPITAQLVREQILESKTSISCQPVPLEILAGSAGEG